MNFHQLREKIEWWYYGDAKSAFYGLRRITWRWRLGYVVFTGNEQDLWDQALTHVPWSWRWFNRTLTPSELNAELGHLPEWRDLRETLEPGDKIYPFLLNPGTLAMRLGIVVARKKHAIGGVVLLLS